MASSSQIRYHHRVSFPLSDTWSDMLPTVRAVPVEDKGGKILKQAPLVEGDSGKLGDFRVQIKATEFVATPEEALAKGIAENEAAIADLELRLRTRLKWRDHLASRPVGLVDITYTVEGRDP